MKAIFPDAKNLQPMPVGISANISRNINSESSVVLPDDQNTAIATAQPVVGAQPIEASSESSMLYVWILVFLLIVIFALVVYRRFRTQAKE